MLFNHAPGGVYNGKQLMFEWLRAQTHSYDGVTVTDLTRSLSDGVALCALLHSRTAMVATRDALPDTPLARLQLGACAHCVASV